MNSTDHPICLRLPLPIQCLIVNVALTIAGSDSSGGAGIQADLKVFTVLGVFGASAITAITAQNTLGVQGVVEIDPAMVRRQIDAVASDLAVGATKTGMLSSRAIIEAVEHGIHANRLQPYVCDPVMIAKSGHKLLADDAIDALKHRLFPLATVITPNLHEAAALAGVERAKITTLESGRDLARRLLAMGPRAVVIKGFESGDQVIDLFHDGSQFVELAAPSRGAGRNHGSGCAFSAAIAGGLARGLDLVAALDQAKALVNSAIQHSQGLGRGTSPVNVLSWLKRRS